MSTTSTPDLRMTGSYCRRAPGAPGSISAAVRPRFDASAADPARVGAAVAEVLLAERPPAHLAVGDGIDDLLALAAQPVEAREAVLADLLANATASRAASAVADG